LISEHEHWLRRDRVVRAVAAHLRAARLGQGLSQEAVAQRAGIAVQTYRSLELNHGALENCCNPTLDTMLRLMYALNMSIEDVDASLRCVND
jgi:transcriptional regulator with XRE-family HTH domain